MFSSRKTVLVVDDNAVNLEVVSDLLNTQGYQVAIAQSGEQAIESVTLVSPDIILLDVMMPPGIDGFETCIRLKTNPESQHIPVLLMTALSDPTDKVTGLSIGAADYITKPFNHAEVLARIKLHLSLRETRARLIQEEKMAALGKMVAGIAHEINNPINFIKGNLKPSQEYIESLLTLVEMYQTKTRPEVIEDYIEDIDLDFIKNDATQLLTSMQTGVDRVEKIVQSLRTFSRLDESDYKEVDLHESLDSTLLILKSRLAATESRPPVQLLKAYGKVPPMMCYASRLNQVFVNLLTNAVDAIDERFSSEVLSEVLYEERSQAPVLKIATHYNDESAVIRITDNGVGIPKSIQPRIFDQFFTTKPVGSGVGLGLSTAHQIVIRDHKGQLSCQSQPGQGAEFTIVLPETGLTEPN